MHRTPWSQCYDEMSESDAWPGTMVGRTILPAGARAAGRSTINDVVSVFEEERQVPRRNRVDLSSHSAGAIGTHLNLAPDGQPGQLAGSASSSPPTRRPQADTRGVRPLPCRAFNVLSPSQHVRTRALECQHWRSKVLVPFQKKVLPSGHGI